LTIALPSWLGPTVIILLCCCAVLKGGLEERLTAASLFINSNVTILLRDTSWPQVQLAGFVADVVSLVLLLAIALWSRKFWPLAAAAFPLSSPLTMLARAAERPEWWPHVVAILWQALWVALILRIGSQLFRKTVLKSGPRTRWWRFGRA